MGPNNEVEHWNPAAEKMFGYTADEIVGRPLHEMLAPPELQAQYGEGLKNFHQSGDGPFVGKYLEMEALHKDGRRFPVAASVAAIALRGKWGAVGIIRDNTERKRAETDLYQAKEAAEAGLRIAGELKYGRSGRVTLTDTTRKGRLNKGEDKPLHRGLLLRLAEVEGAVGGERMQACADAAGEDDADGAIRHDIGAIARPGPETRRAQRGLSAARTVG